MALKIKVSEGPRAGEEFTIRGEVTLGRSSSQSDLPLNDSKASGKHAKIYLDGNNVYQIEDLNSSNGTFVNGAKVKEAPLLSGDHITIGRTVLEVVEISGESKFDKGSWQAEVDEALILAQAKYEKKEASKEGFGYFFKPIRIEITKGENRGKSFVFAFGHRSIGRHCTDATLPGSEIPPLAFELCAIEDGLCEFKTAHDSVLLNSSSQSSAILKEGDLISIGQTELLVKFVDPQ